VVWTDPADGFGQPLGRRERAWAWLWMVADAHAQARMWRSCQLGDDEGAAGGLQPVLGKELHRGFGHGERCLTEREEVHRSARNARAFERGTQGWTRSRGGDGGPVEIAEQPARVGGL
jgi:hypothetical protein